MAVLEITEAEAVARLAEMCAADTYPELSQQDIDRLVEAAKMPDRYGLEPADTGWTPSFELNLAAAEGWLIKAGRAASDVTFTADGASYNRSEVIEHCRQMANAYQSRTVFGVSHLEPVEEDILP